MRFSFNLIEIWFEASDFRWNKLTPLNWFGQSTVSCDTFQKNWQSTFRGELVLGFKSANDGFLGLIIALPTFIARTLSRTPLGPKTTSRDHSQARVFINSKRSSEQHSKNATQFFYYLSIGKLASFLESSNRVCARQQKRWNCSNTSAFPPYPIFLVRVLFLSSHDFWARSVL